MRIAQAVSLSLWFGFVGSLFAPISVGTGAVRAQQGYEIELAVIGDEILGYWSEPKWHRTGPPLFIGLQPDGVFLSGRGDDFGRFPSQWRAGRTTLISQETLTVRWPEQGECVYYVGLAVDGDTELMTWRPYRDYRDFGGFDGIITRAIMPWGSCGPRTWSRQIPEGRTPIRLLPD